MSFESVGNGYTVGSMPDIAGRYEEIQQGLAHRFDDYTNPFKLAQNISNVFQPGIQNAQRQQGLGIEQARQNLAATAQNTLLPLQANMLDAQATSLKAEGSLRNFQLGQMQQGSSEMPGFLGAIADAEQQGDPAALASAASAFPNAVRSNPNIWMDSFNRLSQTQQITNQGRMGSAAATGSDYVSQNPGASIDDITQAYTPTPGLTPLEQTQEKNAYMQGATHQQVQASVAANKGQIQLAAAQLRQTGQIDAATQRALGPLIQKGFFTPNALSAAGVDPDTAEKLQAAVMNGTPNGTGGVVPDKVAVANLGVAKSILNGPLPTTVEKNWAYGVMNSGGGAPFQLPIYPPPVQDKIDLLNQQIMDATNNLKANQSHILWGASDTTKAQNDINALRQQVLTIKNNYVPSAPVGGGFGTNRFNPDGIGQGNSAQTSPVIPGNPETTAAMAQTTSQPSTQAPSANTALPPAMLQKLSPDYQKAYAWAQAHPDDPQSQQIIQRIKTLVSTAR